MKLENVFIGLITFSVFLIILSLLSDLQLPTTGQAVSNLLYNCSDGTPDGQCSITKPKYCAQMTLFDWCILCGCPEILLCNQTSGKCYENETQPVQQICADGTPYGQCSLTKPKYCSNGTLINKCSACGCATGYSCNSTTSACYVPVTAPTPPETPEEPTTETCSDGTPYSTCSLTKPKYCLNGTLTDNCPVCNCPVGYLCNNTKNSCYVPVLPAIKINQSATSMSDEHLNQSVIDESESQLLPNISQTVNRYIVEFKNEPVAGKKAELEYEIKELKEQASRLETEAQGLSGLIKTTRINQAKYIEGVAQGNERELAGQLKEYTRTLLNNQNLAINDIDRRVTSSEQFEVLAKFTNVFNGAALILSEEDVDRVQKSPYVLGVQPDTVVTTLLQDSVPRVGAPELWKTLDPDGQTVTGKGITIAIIDTGIDYTHPDLGGCLGPTCKVIGGYDFVNYDSDPMDDHGHGTHCAGIAAANGVVKGVAPDAELYAYKVLNAGGSGYYSSIIAGIDAAIDPNGDGDFSDHVDVISMSLGGAGTLGDALALAVKRATDAGVAVVAAAGNSGPSMGTVSSPGLAPEAITVGATCKPGASNTYCTDSHLATFSSRGVANEIMIKPEISAPGVYIYSTVPTGICSLCSSSGYASMSGTSMATPHVAGAAALLKQAHPDWTQLQIKSALVTGSRPMTESMWMAGAGEMYILNSSKSNVFMLQSPFMYGLANDPPQNILLYNSGPAVSFDASSRDRLSLYANQSYALMPDIFADRSEVLPIVTAGDASNFTIALSIADPAPSDLEGYYDGYVLLKDGSQATRIPFAYLDLSRLTVHVLDKLDREVYDSRGLVLLYNRPEMDVAILVSSTPTMRSPPATFLLPAGNYSVHSLGHQLFYSFNDAYILSGNIMLNRSTGTVDLYLSMANATEFTINLTTNDGNTIYVKDFMMYVRYVGNSAVSTTSQHSVSTIKGNDIFSIKKSTKLYISDTDAQVGASIAGFSYSADMWDFISRNYGHWFEYSKSNSTEFLIESNADQQYLLLWEFSGVNSSAPKILGLNESLLSTFKTKYDTLGTINSVWGAGGSHLSIGGDATPSIRRLGFTSLNPVFSGMERTNIIQAVFCERYWPGSLYNNYFESTYYIPDYSHIVETVDVPDVYVPERSFLTPIEGVSKSVRIGAGPLYPAIRTMNNKSAFVILHPLLRDQGGARVATPDTPNMYLYRNGASIGIYRLIEHLAALTPLRIIPISSGNSYQAIFTVSSPSQISNTARIVLGFSTALSDMNPPAITSLSMPQRFVPGESIYLELSAIDDVAVGNAAIWWRPSDTSTWQSLDVDSLGSGRYKASIQTTASVRSIDLQFNVSDTSGNYITYLTTNASMKEIPVLFELSLAPQDISYVNGNATVVVTGRLTDLSGNPLTPNNAIPIDFMLNGRKVAMILDDYNTGTGRIHNGTIRFDWAFNPIRLFSGPGETINIDANFDFGIYKPVNRTLVLRSIDTGSTICSDGTSWSQCSSNKPLYCALGELVVNCTSCGCATDYTCNTTTNACYVPAPAPLTCSDGTIYGQCSVTKPKYCDNGNLVDECSICGCMTGLSCDVSGACHVPNAAPEVSKPSLVSTLGTNTSNEDLTCYSEVSDADGDSIELAVNWYVSGTLQLTMLYPTAVGGVNSVLKAANTTTGNVWSCSARAYDGMDYSNGGSWLASNQITIVAPPSNTAPQTPGPALESATGTNTTDEDLYCYDTVMDADGDALDVTVSWYKNNELNRTVSYKDQESGTDIVSVLAAGNTTLGQTWRCKMSVTDGSALKSGESQNLTIIAPAPAPEPAPAPPTGGGGGGGGAASSTTASGTAVTAAATQAACEEKIEVNVFPIVYMGQGSAKEVTFEVNNLGTCSVYGLQFGLTVPIGWYASSEIIDELPANKSQNASVHVIPPNESVGAFSLSLSANIADLQTMHDLKAVVVEKKESVTPHIDTRSMGELVVNYFVFLLLIGFITATLVSLIWFRE